MNSARSFLLDALAQSDVDMNNHKLLNLDTSNLSISGLPPTITPPPNNFLNSWNRVTQIWGFAQVNFSNIAGFLTTPQMTNINQVGTILAGVWQGTPIAANFVPTLDAIRAPINSVSLNNWKITNLANPSNPLDAVNFQTMNSMVPGLQVKAPVAAATTGDNPLVGLNPVDGYRPNAGDRILVMNQATGRHNQNGVWIAALSAWTRAADFNAPAQFPAAYVYCQNGTVNGDTAFVQITPAPVDLVGPDNGTEPNFVVFSTQSQISNGPGLGMSGNTIFAVGTPGRIAVGTGIDIDGNYIGQKSITTVGTISSGTWSGDIIGPSFGGTGANNGSNQFLLNAGSVEMIPSSYGGPTTGNILFRFLSIPTDLTFPAGPDTLVTANGVQALTNKTLDASSIVSGVLPISVGGTGAASAMLAILNLLPPVAGHAGLSLKTDGTTVFWG